MDTKTLSHQVTETSRVQVGAASNDTVFGKAAQFPGHISQNIHCEEIVCANGFILNLHFLSVCCCLDVRIHTRVGDHNECAVGAVLDDLRDDGLEDIDVPLYQVEATLPLLLADTRCHHHQSGVSSHRIVWRRSSGGDGEVGDTDLKLWDVSGCTLSPLSATILEVLRKRLPCWRSINSPFRRSSITSTRANSSAKS